MKRLVICWQVIHKRKNIKSRNELLNHRVFFPPGSFPQLNYWNNAQQQTYAIFFFVPHPLCYSKQDLPVFLIPIYLGINFLILHPELFSCERFMLQYCHKLHTHNNYLACYISQVCYVTNPRSCGTFSGLNHLTFEIAVAISP